jgi:hypothetical protein
MRDVRRHEDERIGSLGPRLERRTVDVDRLDVHAGLRIAIERVETCETADHEHANTHLTELLPVDVPHDDTFAVKLAGR